MNQIEMTFSGKELARAGAKLAEDHAEAEHLGWKDLAYGYLLEFIARHSGREFLTEDVRGYATKNGLAIPPNLRAWGGVMMRAQGAEIIRCVGTRKVKNRKAHSANAAAWVGVM